MKKKLFLLAALFCWQMPAYPADLLEVYQQAQNSDPIFQQAIAQRLSTKEGVPISLSALLPNINFVASPSISRQAFSGSLFSTASNVTGGFLSPRNNTAQAYNMTLTATQTVFNYAQFSNLAGAVATSKQADAILNSALQDLMVRTANAYFAVLRDEENLSYAGATKLAYEKQLDQTKQQYHVGLKTLTDVYTAQASYDSAISDYITAETNLNNDKENLRVITGVYYPHLANLNHAFPLINPQPSNVEKWVKIALLQNWSIKAAQYNTDAALQNIRQQFAGHLPTINVQGSFTRQYANNINGYPSLNERRGPGTETERTLALNLNVPLFSGGGITAQTNQATYNYQIAQQQLEQTIRTTSNTTRQSYANVLAGISKITADKETVKSAKSALEGMQASYEVGLETLVNVLNQQQKVFRAETQYATDRYNFVVNILLLKQAAGTLSFDDILKLNKWLNNKS